MARKRKPAVRASMLSAALRDVVEAIARKVLSEVQRRLPERQQLRQIERQVSRLSRRVGSVGSRPGARRVGRPRSNRRCKLPGCGLPHVAQGLCSKHYQSWRRRKLQAVG